jgi:hypothetical protein
VPPPLLTPTETPPMCGDDSGVFGNNICPFGWQVWWGQMDE